MQDADFLRRIAESGIDPFPRQIYADWLEERGDPRGNFLRWELEQGSYTATDLAYWDLEYRLRCLEPEIDPAWIEQAGCRYNVTLESYGDMKLQAVKIIKDHLAIPLMVAKKVVESAPCVLLQNRTRRQVAPLLWDVWSSASGLSYDAPQFSVTLCELGVQASQRPSRREPPASRQDLELAFLNRIASERFAPLPRLLYGAWLKAIDDPRREFLFFETEILHDSYSLFDTPSLNSSRDALGGEWRERTELTYDVFIQSDSEDNNDGDAVADSLGRVLNILREDVYSAARAMPYTLRSGLNWQKLMAFVDMLNNRSEVDLDSLSDMGIDFYVTAAIPNR